jgi:ATP-dependent Zn protease
MLYIIGGASRSGKTLLARRAVVEKKIPYFPMDALFGALA